MNEENWSNPFFLKDTLDLVTLAQPQLRRRVYSSSRVFSWSRIRSFIKSKQVYLLETALVSAMVLWKSETLSSLAGRNEQQFALGGEVAAFPDRWSSFQPTRLPRISTPEFVITWFRSAWASPRPRALLTVQRPFHTFALYRENSLSNSWHRGDYSSTFSSW